VKGAITLLAAVVLLAGCGGDAVGGSSLPTARVDTELTHWQQLASESDAARSTSCSTLTT
jgi:ABC-type glycerol-3-phosphate transport system substrate-binding protein